MKSMFDKIKEIINQSINISYKEPDYIMIHSIKKEILLKELFKKCKNIPHNVKNIKVFGIKIIWTDDINEDEMICTYITQKL